MKSLQEFLQNFFKNKGQYVFLSLLIAKICGLISSIAVVRMLPQSDFGMMTIVASVFAVFATFSGLGSSQGFLRFGAIAEQAEEKEKLHQHFFRSEIRRCFANFYIFHHSTDWFLFFQSYTILF